MRALGSVALVVVLFDIALFCTAIVVVAAVERGKGWLTDALVWGCAAILVVAAGGAFGQQLAPMAGVVAAVVFAGFVWMVPRPDRPVPSSSDTNPTRGATK